MTALPPPSCTIYSNSLKKFLNLSINWIEKELRNKPKANAQLDGENDGGKAMVSVGKAMEKEDGDGVTGGQRGGRRRTVMGVTELGGLKARTNDTLG
ncbi:hypothetical protein L2E82_29284 [Cichorium intybus]|uniref:Uncharacterized protein n=1 Tax=Cichorium intybus TaxID=13427 RepID=A0ACB9CXB4_CICIN|nr:hypothetical protein L2E82_29284 [Cichorium intybus]